MRADSGCGHAAATLSTRPSAINTAARLTMAASMRRRSPALAGGRSTNDIATPMITMNAGKMKSAAVAPCQAACVSGG